uniref:Uncharacterized protein n=1 Tax=Candidatus Methanophagaceae archaeon ANME-1 ERB6 TaxID=2759912 RepID=A0A7G9Z036_9EURY|nr:hypothetical protein NGENPBHE_00020 [Methanosarcinales archaeon ANME-1 ERB6]
MEKKTEKIIRSYSRVKSGILKKDKNEGGYVKQEISGFTERTRLREIINLEIGQSEQNPPINIRLVAK